MLSISYEDPNVFSPSEGSFHTALLGLLMMVWKFVPKHIGEAHVGSNIHYPSSAISSNEKKGGRLKTYLAAGLIHPCLILFQLLSAILCTFSSFFSFKRFFMTFGRFFSSGRGTST